MFEYRYYNSPTDNRPITITHDDCEFFRILGWTDETKESRNLERKVVSIRNPGKIFETGFDGTFKNEDGTEDTVHFNFIFAGAGDTRKQRALFATDEVRHAVIPYIMNGLTMEDVNTPINGKYPCSGLRFTTYESLWFTGSKRIENFDIDKCIVINDIEEVIEYDAIKVDAPKDYVGTELEHVKKKAEITDGAGMFLPGTFDIKGRKNKYITAFTARAPWFKGLMVQHDFRAAALRTGNHIVKDAWGQEHDIIAEGINCIWTTSQLKLWKAYKNWDHYKRYFKELHQYFCYALVPEDKHNLILSYQPLQTLVATHNEVKAIMETSKQRIWRSSGKNEDGNVVNYKETLKALGVQDMPVFKELTEPMLNMRYCIDRVKKYLDNEIDKLGCGEISLPGYEPFVSPDWNHVCNVLFGDSMPEVPKGNVSCPYFHYGIECDIIRYPHLYPGAHCVRTNVKVEGLTSEVVYADHDGITAILCEADYDGDHLQMFVADKKANDSGTAFVDMVKKEINQAPPIYYECGSGKKYPVVFAYTPESEIVYDEDNNRIHKHYLFDELADSYGGKANVGIPSNWATRILNSTLPIETKRRYVALMAHCVQGRIDYPKTGESYDVPKEVIEYIKTFELPHFMELKKYNEDNDRLLAKNRGIKSECNIEVLGLGNFNPTIEEKELINKKYKERRKSLKDFQHYAKARSAKDACNTMDFFWLEKEDMRKKMNTSNWFIEGKNMFELNKPRYFETKEESAKAMADDDAFRKKYVKFIYDCQSKSLHPIWRERINMMTMVDPDPAIQAETDKRFREEFHCNINTIKKLFAFALRYNMFLSFCLYVWPNEFLVWAKEQGITEAVPAKERTNMKYYSKEYGRLGDKEAKAEGGRNGTPAKNGKVVKVDTGEIIFEGSYEQCQDYIGMKGNHFAEKAQSNSPYKSKVLGFKVLCIIEEVVEDAED